MSSRLRMWLMLFLLIGVIVGAMFALMLQTEQATKEAKLAGSVGEPRNNYFLVDELDRTPSVSRDHERDPLSAALDYSEHMATYEPPIPTPTPTPTSISTSVDVNVSNDGLNWSALASCESGGNPSIVSSNGLWYGLYQFTIGTWQSVGGTGLPTEASPEEQTARAQTLYNRSGDGPWPNCGYHLYD